MESGGRKKKGMELRYVNLRRYGSMGLNDMELKKNSDSLFRYVKRLLVHP